MLLYLIGFYKAKVLKAKISCTSNVSKVLKKIDISLVLLHCNSLFLFLKECVYQMFADILSTGLSSFTEGV